MNKSNIKEYVWDFIICFAACVIFSIGVNVFVIPNDLVQGGLMGIAIIINKIFPFLKTGIITFFMNIPLFILSWKKIGGPFIVKSFVVTTMLSICLDVFNFFPAYRGDSIIISLSGGVLSGISLALVFIRGATTGGTDILAKLIRMKFPNITLGKIILFFDFLVISISAIISRNIETALYSLILIFVSTYCIDYFIYGASHSKTLMIVTSKYREISYQITDEVKRGLTLVPVEGGYTGKQKKMIVCAVRGNEVVKINQIVRKTDANAFTIISDAGEIIGLGFRKRD